MGINNDIERQRKHFDSIAEKYYSKRQSNNHIRFKEKMWKYFFKDKDYLKQKTRVLEAMCGYAEGKNILENYLGTKIDYTGFDFSKEIIKKVTKENPSVNVIYSDITRFESPDKYNLVILLGGLHHVPRHVNASIKRLRSVLDDGGYFINFEPTHNNKLFNLIRSGIYKRNALFDEKTEQAFELNDLNQYFINNDFELVDQIYPGLFSYILYYNPDAFPFLNIGGKKIVDVLFNMEKMAYTTIVGKRLSFATLSLWRKI